MQFPELDPTKPHIAVLIPTEDGYRAQTLCLVDGRPARVSIDVDTRKFRYSSYSIELWDTVYLQWNRVYNLTGQDVGPMSLLHDSPETQEKVNSIAELLWWQANVIVVNGRRRTEDIEIDFEVRKAQAIALTVPTYPINMAAHVDPAAYDNGGLRMGDSVKFVSDAEVGTEIVNLLGGLRDRTKAAKAAAYPADETYPTTEDVVNWTAKDSGLDESDLAALRAKLEGEA